jgi:phosphoglycerate dehydrogenase-like enzyme
MLAGARLAPALSTRWRIRKPGLAALATRPFHELPNVLMTPHVSGWTDGMLDARAKLTAENIRRIACQETPLNLLAP